MLTWPSAAAAEVLGGTLDGRSVLWRWWPDTPQMWAAIAARQALKLQHPNLRIVERVFVSSSGIAQVVENMEHCLTDVLETYEIVKMTEPHIAYVLKEVRRLTSLTRSLCVFSLLVSMSSACDVLSLWCVYDDCVVHVLPPVV